MTFLFDHDVPDRVAQVLRREGHTVILLREVLPRETEDIALLDYASQHGHVLVTCNREDFLPFANESRNPGMIILNRRPTRLAECAAMLKLVRTAGESGLVHNVNFA